MTQLPNLSIYRFWAPVYDTFFRPLTTHARRETLKLLALQPGERLLIPCVGTGLDLPFVTPDVKVTAGDISSEMLARAKPKTTGKPIGLCRMDAQDLDYPAACFDAVLFSLTLSCVPDGRAAFGEAWRVLRPGGRIAIFDKFIPEGQALTPLRRWLGRVIRFFGTDPNRSLSEIIDGWPGLKVVHNQPSLLAGQYRIILIEKSHNS
jgi:ubiquinone/menaquinone biosynthesis C-methylase UbiE